MLDCLIIGSGPAGISASLYAVRAGLKTAVIGGVSDSLERAAKIDNYYGLPGISGSNLQQTGIEQAKSLGVQVFQDEVLGVSIEDCFVTATLSEGFKSKTLILATGSARKTPSIKGLKNFEGKGVSYCAVCDGFFFKNKEVCVLGGGNYALSEARELKGLGCKVTILTNGDTSDNIFDGFNVKIEKIASLKGGKTLSAIVFADKTEISASGLFIALGTAGALDLARKIGLETDGLSVKTDNSMSASLPGVFACGDCVGAPYQINKAVYEGMLAAMSAVKFIRS